jgi:hypothetical protein
MWLAGSPNKVDNLVVGVSGDVSAVDENNLVALIQFWVTPVRRIVKL